MAIATRASMSMSLLYWSSLAEHDVGSTDKAEGNGNGDDNHCEHTLLYWSFLLIAAEKPTNREGNREGREEGKNTNSERNERFNIQRNDGE